MCADGEEYNTTVIVTGQVTKQHRAEQFIGGRALAMSGWSRRKLHGRRTGSTERARAQRLYGACAEVRRKTGRSRDVAKDLGSISDGDRAWPCAHRKTSAASRERQGHRGTVNGPVWLTGRDSEMQ